MKIVREMGRGAACCAPTWFKRTSCHCHPIAMNSLALILGLVAPAHPLVKPSIQYTLRVDSADLSGWTVEIRIRTSSDTVRLAMAAHPEYDDRYWRYVRDFVVEPGGATATRLDSAVWQVVAPPGVVNVRYRIALPPAEPGLRASWRPFLTPTGGLIGGPHSFMYVLGAEDSTVLVELALPASWPIATGLTATRDPRYFTAAGAAVLEDSPILAGHFRQWSFVEGGSSHRVVYWPLPEATPFDTAAFVSGIRRLVHQAVALFGRTPYREYTFQFADGAYGGGLEHRNSVTLGARSEELARDPNSGVQETAHEFVHTWNLMAIRPVEYRDIDYRTQPPVSSLWFSEGLTMFYADLLLRRAGVALRDSTRIAHLGGADQPRCVQHGAGCPRRLHREHPSSGRADRHDARPDHPRRDARPALNGRRDAASLHACSSNRRPCHRTGRGDRMYLQCDTVLRCPRARRRRHRLRSLPRSHRSQDDSDVGGGGLQRRAGARPPHVWVRTRGRQWREAYCLESRQYLGQSRVAQPRPARTHRRRVREDVARVAHQAPRAPHGGFGARGDSPAGWSVRHDRTRYWLRPRDGSARRHAQRDCSRVASLICSTARGFSSEERSPRSSLPR